MEIIFEAAVLNIMGFNSLSARLEAHCQFVMPRIHLC